MDRIFPKSYHRPHRPEIITMLGIRGDESALPLVSKSLSDTDLNVRKEAAEALVKLGGNETVNSLVDYILLFTGAPDQEAAKSALMTAAGRDKMPLLIPVLKDGDPAVRKTVIELLAWSKEYQYFSAVLPYTSSPDLPVKTAAFKALENLAGPDDQTKLIDLLAVTETRHMLVIYRQRLPPLPLKFQILKADHQKFSMQCRERSRRKSLFLFLHIPEAGKHLQWL